MVRESKEDVIKRSQDSALLDRLAEQGVLRRATVSANYILERRPINLGGSVVDALLEERNEGA